MKEFALEFSLQQKKRGTSDSLPLTELLKIGDKGRIKKIGTKIEHFQ